MTHDHNSFKKIAALTGLTVLIGGAEISNADAATVSQTDTFDFSVSNLPSPNTATDSLSFAGFNNSLGTLTGVSIALNAPVSVTGDSFGASASVTLFPMTASSDEIFSKAFSSPGNSFFTSATWPGALTPFESSFSALLSLTSNSEDLPGGATWDGNGEDEGLTITYTYTAGIAATPLPATLPLFASGLAGLGFTTWRRRRKQTVK